MGEAKLPKRARSHDIDSLALRSLFRALPDEWEPRYLTGHDYGIDLLIQLFDSSVPTGSVVNAQVKGIDVTSLGSRRHTVKVPARTLHYAELSAVPVVLCVVPVRADTASF